MDTNRATTLLTRAVFGAVIALPTLLIVDYLEMKVAFRECDGRIDGGAWRQTIADLSYSFRGAQGDNDITVSLRLP